jgi:pimeloyl-[acyl-carrier protein] methyl ester esterase
MSLHIEITGSGPSLVMIHGWGMHSGVWQPLVKKLSRNFTLHLVDLPGMGFSQPVEPSHLHAVAEKVAERIPGNADICGWSLGGLVAMRIALSYPEHVRRMVLVGSTPRFVNTETEPPWSHGIESEVFQNFATQVGQDYQATLIKFLTLQCMGSSDSRATINQLRTSFAERPVPTAGSLQKALRMLLENDLREEIPFLRKPVLLMHGDRDTLAPLQAAHWLAQHLPFGRLRVMAGGSHAPFLSHPEQFIEALVQFLEPENAG